VFAALVGAEVAPVPVVVPDALRSVGKTPAGADDEEEADTLATDPETDPPEDEPEAGTSTPVTLPLVVETTEVA